jgi:cytochrome c oxidase accessory protein FixG
MSQQQGEGFRDSLGIVSREGKRSWIYPKEPSGPLYRARTATSLFLLAILFGVPFLKVDGHSVMLLNVVERKFILFGAVFGPHDFYLLVLGMITLIVFIILLTVAFGRVFCGWVCPQTVLMEMVFRRIDYWLEGDHRAQRALNDSPWNLKKLMRKGTKYTVYFVLSFLIGNMLLSWIIGIDELRAIVTDPPLAHAGGLTAMMAFSGIFYWIFIWFREQACILVCPYGRLQGVLLDRNSIVIAYDNVRGEPRGKLRRDTQRKEGDCIDCHLCVDVCPTGIDIRNGTQLECVNCTACIDACNDVMVRIEKPRGLIRYASLNAIASREKFRITGRMAATGVVFVLLAASLTGASIARKPLNTTILRTPGMFFQEQPDGRVSNVYDVQVLNATFDPAVIRFELEGLSGTIALIGDSLKPPPQGIAEGKFLVILSRDALQGMSTPITIGVYSREHRLESVRTTFLGPGKTP